MIEAALKFEDGQEKEALFFVIANHMKKCFLNWNKDTVEDKVIFDHLVELSDGKIDLRNADETLSNSDDLIRLSNKRFGRQKPQPHKNKKFRSKRRK